MDGQINTRLKLLTVLLGLLLLNSCASYDIVKMGNIDKAQKTMTVPNISFSLTEIKMALIKDGWKLKASEEGLITEGINNETINTQTKIYYKSRYRMTIQESIRMSQWVLKTYISVVDNETNEEVLLITGDSNGAGGVSPATTAKKLIAALNEIEK